MKYLLSLLFLIQFHVCFAGTASKETSNALIGTWEIYDGGPKGGSGVAVCFDKANTFSVTNFKLSEKAEVQEPDKYKGTYELGKDGIVYIKPDAMNFRGIVPVSGEYKYQITKVTDPERTVLSLDFLRFPLYKVDKSIPELVKEHDLMKAGIPK